MRLAKQQPLALVYSTAEYCDPAWCHSNKTPSINKPVNDALRMITGCLRTTSTNSLTVLAEKKNKKKQRISDKTSHDSFG